MFGGFDALAANDEGYRLLKQGQVQEALALLGESARAGVPWALATCSWHFLVRGNPGAALSLAEVALPACEQWIGSLEAPDLADSARYQVINSRSNLALCGLAMGYEPSEALAVWEEGIELGHVESAFYPAIVAHRAGNSIAARATASALPAPVLAGLRASFGANSVEASPWFAQWCADGLALLDLIGFEPPSVDSLNVDGLRVLPELRESGEISAEDWDTLRLVHQEDQALTEQGLRRLAGSDRSVSHAAAMELGTLLVEIGHFLSPRYREGWDLLVTSLDAPFRDVVAVAAWNISAEFRRQGAAEAAEDFGHLALELGDAQALAHYMRVAQEVGDREAARHLALRADALGNMSPAAVQARAILALEAAETQEAHVRDWFTRSQGSLPAELIAGEAPIYAWRGDYNVDVASAAVATQFFDSCDITCYFESSPGDCEDCGRVSDRFVYVASGAGDGGYSAFSLYSPAGLLLGVFTAFMGALDGRPLVGSVADLRDWMDSSAPLFLGTLDSQGLITVGDASMSTDDRDVSIDFDVPPGNYAVVCWVSRSPSVNELLPIALAAGTGPLGEVFGRELVRLPKSERDRLIVSMWGAPNRLVHSLMGDIRPEVLARNYEALKELDPARAQSYALQWAERNDAEDVRSFIAESFGCGSKVALEALDSRGWLEPGLPWWRPDMARDPRDIWGRVLAARDHTVTLGDQTCRDVVWVRRAAARHPRLSADQAGVLARDPDLRVRLNVARNAATPADVLADLTESPDVEVAAAAASQENCPASALVRLGRAKRCSSAVAANPSTPIDVVEGIADSPLAAARASVAGRRGISASTLDHLADDPDLTVRAAVAGNPGISTSAARCLLSDHETWVRNTLASNPHVPPEIVADLTLDSDEGV